VNDDQTSPIRQIRKIRGSLSPFFANRQGAESRILSAFPFRGVGVFRGSKIVYVCVVFTIGREDGAIAGAF
jgi:hypothetical protein